MSKFLTSFCQNSHHKHLYFQNYKTKFEVFIHFTYMYMYPKDCWFFMPKMNEKTNKHLYFLASIFALTRVGGHFWNTSDYQNVFSSVLQLLSSQYMYCDQKEIKICLVSFAHPGFLVSIGQHLIIFYSGRLLTTFASAEDTYPDLRGHNSNTWSFQPSLALHALSVSLHATH